jgi:hypothetical protein
MIRTWSTAAAAILVSVTGACASHNKEAAPPVQPSPAVTSTATTAPARKMAPAAALPDVAGSWAWTASVAGNEMDGTMHLEHATTGGYTGGLQAQGLDIPLTDIEIAGRAYSFKVQAPDGVYTVKGNIVADGTMEGTVDGPPGPGSFKAKKN